MTMTSATYYPEMGQKPQPALFHTSHVIGSTMGLKWLDEDDAKAREAFKRLRIRPRWVEQFTSRLRGVKKWSASCTIDAERKLYAAGLVCREMLLD